MTDHKQPEPQAQAGAPDVVAWFDPSNFTRTTSVRTEVETEALITLQSHRESMADWVQHYAITEKQLLDAIAKKDAELTAVKAAYQKMRNAAAGYSNFCEDSASVRRCEKDMEQAENMFRAAIAQAEGALK